VAARRRSRTATTTTTTTTTVWSWRWRREHCHPSIEWGRHAIDGQMGMRALSNRPLKEVTKVVFLIHSYRVN
jgi:hypothetical protein